jgi:hypothetical protein
LPCAEYYYNVLTMSFSAEHRRKMSVASQARFARMTLEERRAHTASATERQQEWFRKAKELMAREKAAKAKEGELVS